MIRRGLRFFSNLFETKLPIAKSAGIGKGKYSNDVLSGTPNVQGKDAVAPSIINNHDLVKQLQEQQRDIKNGGSRY